MADFYEEGGTCNRDGCTGVIKTHAPENCSCHISPPCGTCTGPRNFCPECDWEESDDPELSTPVAAAKERPADMAWWNRPMRTVADMDGSKIEWISKSHSNSSMIKEGRFPIGTSYEELRKLVDGTFGGRFEYCNMDTGHFKFIAYTD